MAGHLIDERANGVFVIAATPFKPDGALDLESLDRLIAFYTEAGVDGITLLGMMGEAQKLTYDESRLVVQRVLFEVAGERPVLVGVSSPGLATLAALTSDVMALGAAGVMIAPPRGLETDEQILTWMGQVADAIGHEVPVVFQDYPQATGVHVSAPLFGRLVEAFPQIKVLKHEDCPGLAKLSRIREAEAAGQRRVAILVGNGCLYYPMELARGADGAMSGFSFPEVMVRTHQLFMAGDAEAANDLFDLYLPLIRHEQQPGIGLAIRKAILHRRRVIASPTLRPPGASLGPVDHAELDLMLTRLERRLKDGLRV